MVLISQKLAESDFRSGIVVKLYGRFIVQLPSDDARVVAVVLCQFLYHFVG